MRISSISNQASNLIQDALNSEYFAKIKASAITSFKGTISILPPLILTTYAFLSYKEAQKSTSDSLQDTIISGIWAAVGIGASGGSILAMMNSFDWANTEKVRMMAERRQKRVEQEARINQENSEEPQIQEKKNEHLLNNKSI